MKLFIANNSWFYGFEAARPNPLALLAEVRSELACLADRWGYDAPHEAECVSRIADLVDRYLSERAVCMYVRPLTKQEVEFYRVHPQSHDLIKIPTYAPHDHGVYENTTNGAGSAKE